MKRNIIPIIICAVLIPILIVLVVINNQDYDEDNNINTTTTTSEKGDTKVNNFIIIINNKELKVKLENNSSVDALLERLSNGDITINAHDYGNFEKVGDLGFTLPRNDKNYTTKPGDIILYQGNSITLYYDTNTWNFTKLGEVIDITDKELKELLGNGDVVMTLRGIND